jgi:hypothetical protein
LQIQLDGSDKIVDKLHVVGSNLYVAYPQFYQTHPAVFARPIMGRPIESHQRNICKNNNAQVVPCYKMDQSGIKPVINLFKSMREKIQENTEFSAFTRPVNPVFYSISEGSDGPSEDFVKKLIEHACQNPGVFRKSADFWDGIEVDELFGQSEEDLVFRKLTEIDRLLMKDFGTVFRSVGLLIEDACANLNSEKINSIWAKMADVAIVLEGETDEKIQDYVVTVCGWEISQDVQVIQSTYGITVIDYSVNIWQISGNMAKIPYIQKVIQDIQENSKDWRCANRVTKYLNASIDLLIKRNEIQSEYSEFNEEIEK